MMLLSIKDIISDKIIFNICNQCDYLEIQENDNKGKNNTLKKVLIKKINDPTNFIAFKLDKYKLISNNYNEYNRKGINKGVDAIFINNEHILLFELKSTRINKTLISQKFFSSVSFLKGVSDLLRYYYNSSLNDLMLSVIVIGLKRSNNRIYKTKPREIPLSFNKKRYVLENGISLQVLEILNNRPRNIEVNYEKIINNLTSKKFKNWP